MGDLLRIDLTTRTTSEETVPPQLIKELIGAKGIGTHYLCEEVAPEVDPLSPDNKLIFVVGPMGGTTMLGSNRYALYFASPLTGGYGECYSGGNLTPQFARTGYKVVIVEGKADAPGLPRDQRGGRRLPRRLRPLGHGRLQGRGRDPRAHPAQEGPGLRHRPGRREARPVRLRQQQLLAPARPRRPRRGVRLQEPQGHRLARREEGRGRAPGRLQGRGPRPHRAHQGRRRRRRVPARRHAQHGAHHERRQRVPHALLAQGHARELRAHHRRDHARRARHRQPDVPAVRVQVRQAQHRVQGPARGARGRGSRVRDRLRLRRPLRDRRLRRDHVAQRRLRPPRRRHHGRRQPVRPRHRVRRARPHRREAHLERPRRRRRLPREALPARGHRRPVGRGPRSRSPRSTASRTWPCTPRAWRRPATSRAR